MADFSAEERRKLAKEGKAMRDGSFPIRNRDDLKNAIGLAGNSKDPKKARRFIIRRARAIGASGMIPETWNSDGSADK